MSTEEDTELRDLVAQTLEVNGCLPKIRAELRASIFLALDEGDEGSFEMQHPDIKILTFLTLITNMLKNVGAFDIDTICSQLEKCCIDADTSSTVLDNADLKSLLFSEKNFVPCLEISVKALMDFLLHQIQTEDMKYYKKILMNLATPMGTVVEMLDKHVDSEPIRKSVLEFVGVLLQLLGEDEAPLLKEKPGLQLFVTKILKVFKKVRFVRKRIMRELCTKLKHFHNCMVEFSQQSPVANACYSAPYHENIMLNLSVLTEMLLYDVHQSEGEPENSDKSDDNTVVNIRCTLRELMHYKYPEYIQPLLDELMHLVT